MNRVLLLFIFFSFKTQAQSGQWTWMHGYNTLNGAGVFGTQGIPDANNKPPALWSSFFWTDSDGNFWLFGGLRNGSEYAALWKYNPTSNMWTWMKGPNSTSQSGVYGTQGIPSAANYPGSRAWGSCAWVDSHDDLWLFGGQGRDYNGDYGQLGDIWKYTIATNEWTWMAGSNNTYPAAVFGTLQVPAPANTPGGRISTRACWLDNANNIWLFGGEGIVGGSQFSDVWKFDPSTNQWAWMKGPTTTNAPRVFGPVGVFDNSYTPGGRSAYSSWVDQSGKFWMFGGIKGYSDYYADMWSFDPVTLQWAFMGGTTALGANANAGLMCESSTAFHPGNRYQNTACWTDQYGRFWQYGGFNLSGTAQDLWCFDPLTLEWTWTGGDLSPSLMGSYGMLGVPAASNIPYASGGNAAWYDHAGNLWLYGGYTYYGANGLGDLWKFTPDINCPEVEILPIELIQFDVTAIENSSVLLEWSTASELNNQNYIVEHSQNAIDFNAIAEIPGKGNSTTIQKYSSIDKQPLQGINYYRIKQRDYDGKISYTPVKSILVSPVESVTISVENPSSNPVKLNLKANSADWNDNVMLLIMDVYERLVGEVQSSGYESLVLPYLPNGTYFIYLKEDKTFRLFKLIVQ